MDNIVFSGLTCFKVFLKVNRSPLSNKENLLILESDPNPDYYSKKDFPPNKKHLGDRHFYLMVKNQVNCFQDLVLRVRQKIKENSNLKMRIYPGYMSFQNKNVPCIRIDAVNIDDLPLLINEFHDFGIKFVKDHRVHEYESYLHFKKFIRFKEVDKDIYQDNDNQHRYFFKIPKSIEPEDFINGIKNIKFSCDFHSFDSFQAELFVGEDVFDFIGIYSRHCDKQRFTELKQHLKDQFDSIK
jgi:hypothetical protein